MALAPDIESLIDARFSDGRRARTILAVLVVRADEYERVVRCILELSGSDTDALEAWVKRANADYRNIIWYAEYDSRNVRQNDFSKPFDRAISWDLADLTHRRINTS